MSVLDTCELLQYTLLLPSLLLSSTIELGKEFGSGRTECGEKSQGCPGGGQGPGSGHTSPVCLALTGLADTDRACLKSLWLNGGYSPERIFQPRRVCAGGGAGNRESGSPDARGSPLEQLVMAEDGLDRRRRGGREGTLDLSGDRVGAGRTAEQRWVFAGGEKGVRR